MDAHTVLHWHWDSSRAWDTTTHVMHYCIQTVLGCAERLNTCVWWAWGGKHRTAVSPTIKQRVAAYVVHTSWTGDAKQAPPRAGLQLSARLVFYLTKKSQVLQSSNFTTVNARSATNKPQRMKAPFFFLYGFCCCIFNIIYIKQPG